jgi:hypothetical protein
MLNEDEYRLVHSKRGAEAPTENRAELVERFFGPMLREYERITSLHETNPNAVHHHRLSLYAPPCSICGKPLRTPKARFCAACGKWVGAPVESGQVSEC